MKNKKFDKIYIEITNRCNLNCNFCFNTKREKRDMTTEEFKKIIKEVKDKTNLILLHVKGEPLLSPYLEEILEECEKNNMKVNITTNGTLSKEKKEILLKSKAIRQINISLHSYIENKGIKSNYLEEITEVVEEIVNKTNSCISYRLWNLECLKNNMENEIILMYLGEKYKKEGLLVLAREKKSIRLGEKIFLNQDIQFTWPDLHGKEINHVGTCYGLRKQIAILVNGDVVPCCLDGEGNIILGNIYENSLEEILNTKRAIEIRQNFEQNKLIEPLCRTCGFIEKRIKRK